MSLDFTAENLAVLIVVNPCISHIHRTTTVSLDYQESDPEEIFTKVQQKYKSALHDYWRIAALDFDKQNDLYINDAWKVTFNEIK